LPNIFLKEKMSIASKAWLKYVDEVRGDSTNLYYCSRLLEKAYLLLSDPDGITLMRKAARGHESTGQALHLTFICE
jgi:hypothetical protein